MARVKGGGKLDMRKALAQGEMLEATANRIVIGHDDRLGVFEGAFGYTALGLPTGTLRAFSLRIGGETVLEATGIGRDAAVAIATIARHGDGDRFLAHILSGNDRIEGTAAADYLLGFDGRDVIRGRGGDDLIFGGSGRDRLYGGAGDDLLAGGKGADRLHGGAGDDLYIVDHVRDRIFESAGGGWDEALASVSFTLPDHVEALGLTGTAAIDGRGNAAANVITGNAAANVLRGMKGDDVLKGLPGDDLLIGGPGRDLLSGGHGRDVYRFLAASDSRPGGGRPDKILDFWQGEDVIDLSPIDADPLRPGDQAFRFIGQDAFTGAGGELRATRGRVSADIDGDRWADLAIDLEPQLVLGFGDFIL